MASFLGLQALASREAVFQIDITDDVMLKSIEAVAGLFMVPDIRIVFENQCYTNERCAVCQEFHQDLTSKNIFKLPSQEMVTFCSRLCLFNGWVDMLTYLKSHNISICMMPTCLMLIPNNDLHVHNIFEIDKIMTYLGSVMNRDKYFKVCSDPLCNRVGVPLNPPPLSSLYVYNPSDTFCCRKHRIASKVCMPGFQWCNNTVEIPESDTHKNDNYELRLEYPYAPVSCDDLWFHSAYHAVQFQRFSSNPTVAEEIRLSTSIGEVDKIVSKNEREVTGKDSTSFLALSDTIKQLI